jgi:hypothetical protein
MTSVTFTYELNPPVEVTAPGLNASAKHDFPIAASPQTTDAYVSYYTALRTTVAEARAKLGEELTIWRDAVGKKETEKEKAKPAKPTEDDEDTEEGDEEEL